MSLFVSIGECMLELSAAARDLWHLGIAGDTLNTAWYARAFLPESWEVSYVTRLGQDAFSQRAVDFMAAHGIGTDHVSRHPDRLIGLYAITLAEGERSFAYWRDTSAARTLMEAPEVVERALSRAAVIHVSGITLAILPAPARLRLTQLLAVQRRRGAICVLDPNYRPRLWPDVQTAQQAVTAAARASSILLPSRDDEAALFGDATAAATLARYAALGVETVVLKDADRGVHLSHDGVTQTLADLPRVQPIDTTGAGDSFNGAFLAAWLAGLGPEAAVRKAHAVAARVVRTKGALIPMADLRAAD